MIESNLQKQLQKTFSNLGRHSGRIFNENNSGADGLRTKTYRFFGFGWYQNRRKIEEESIKKIFSRIQVSKRILSDSGTIKEAIEFLNLNLEAGISI